ncbi:lipid-A-disaccharide synthase [Holospora obtusa F1]|uniref:Lipid-A-disaccharide synthase n=1 Tax=Holospora obtusa F1 TaxID=1399147 RepID=W6TD22_HOLOB|nr:lipid-A-disaccharide synthase [Holospora obtusa]ETZ06778.1 lipid-A-disaccharide synthase [Holospora obtusa F1]
MTADNRLVWIILGEPSGDLLGSALLTILRQQYPNITFRGIAGPLTERVGQFVSLFPYTDICHMGIGSIVKNGIFLIKRYYQTVRAICAQRPDLLLTIDCPEFSLRVSRAVRNVTKRVHCVAPSVWAWRKGRAKTLAQKTDYLLHLFEFEKNFFSDLPCFWIGHPLADQVPAHKDEFLHAYPEIVSSHCLIAILPGSRLSEIKNCWPVFKQSVENLKNTIPFLQSVVITLPEYEKIFVKDGYLTVTNPLLKRSVFANSAAALACSGTVTLELALCKTPTVIGYRVHPVLAWGLRRLIKTPYVGLSNVLAQEMIAPECLQENFTSEYVTKALKTLLECCENQDIQKGFQKILSNVRTPQGFSLTGARVIAKILGLPEYL